MRAVVQRVEKAQVRVEEKVVGSIGRGLLVLLAVESGDEGRDLEWMRRKLVQLRVFESPQGRMDLSLQDIGGELLLVSQFTLMGDCRKGNRPSFSRAAAPALASQIYQELVSRLRQDGIRVATGEFQAMMKVELVNHGPVTVILSSRKEFY